MRSEKLHSPTSGLSLKRDGFNEKGVFSVTYGGGHFNIVRNVVLALERRGVPTLTLALTGALASARRYLPGGSVLSVSDLMELLEEDYPQVKRLPELGRMALAASGIIKHVTDARETEAYLGAGIEGLLEKGLSLDEALALLARKGRVVLDPTPLARLTLELLNPAAILATNSPRMERAFLGAGVEMGKRSVCCCDMLGNTELLPLKAHFICVSGEVAARAIAQGEHSFEKILVTGQPALDWTQSLQRDRAFMADDCLRILYAAQPTGESGEIMKKLASLASGNSRLRVMTTLHPGSPVPDIPFPLNGLGPQGRETRGLWEERFAVLSGGTRPLLTQCDILVSQFSTVLLEARSLGVPALSLGETRDKRFSPLASLEGVLLRPVVNLEEIVQNLLKSGKKISDPADIDHGHDELACLRAWLLRGGQREKRHLLGPPEGLAAADAVAGLCLGEELFGTFN